MPLTVPDVPTLSLKADRTALAKALKLLRDEAEARLAAIEAGGSGEVKPAVRLASTANIANLASVSTTFGGGTIVEGDRVLLKDQTAGQENWIYDAGPVAGGLCALTRSSDSNTSAEVTSGIIVAVSEGTHADTAWKLDTNDPITLGVTVLVITQVPWGFGAGGAVANVDGAAAAAGTSALAARVDHKHSLPAAAAPADVDGAAAVAGVSNNVARADHKHSLPAAVAPADVTKAAAVAGTSNVPARADHKHDASTGVAVAISAASAEGAAATLARSDHTHEVTSRVRVVTQQVTHAELVAGATSQTLNIGAPIPAGSYILGASASLPTTFSGGGASSLVVDIGSAGDDDAIVDNANLFAAVDGQAATMPAGINPNKFFSGSTQLTAKFTSDVNVADLNAGDCTIRVLYAVP